MSSDRKKISFLILLFVPLLLGSVLFLSWSSIRVNLLSWVLKSYSERFFGLQLDYANAHFDQDNHLWLDQPQLKDFASQEIYFQAPKAELRIAFHLWKRALKTSISI